MQLAATLLLLLSTPFFLRYWQARSPRTLDTVANWLKWAMETIPVSFTLYVGLGLAVLGVILGVAR